MAASDDYASFIVPPYAPCRHAAAVTPSDAADLADVTRFLWVGGAGNAAVVMQDGTSVTITGIAAGALLPVAVARVKATLTTATNILALW